MVSDKKAAKIVSDTLMELFVRIDKSCDEVALVTSEDDAAPYRKAIGRIAAAIVMDLMEPLYKQHPDLRPKNWED